VAIASAAYAEQVGRYRHCPDNSGRTKIWYPRTTASATLTERGLTPLFFEALEGGTVIGFKISPRGVDHLAAWNNHDVYSCQWFMASKQLSNEAFRPVAHHGVAELPAGGDA
jgi:hypothetical protein